MFIIKAYDTDCNHRVLPMDSHLFHRAARFVIDGETSFHVHGENGLRFDIEYFHNNNARAEGSPIPSDMFLYPSYLYYDESDVEKLDLFIVEGFDCISFTSTSEYSIVLARLFLKYTDKSIFCKDERIRWFIEDSRLIIGEPENDDDKVLHVVDEFQDYLLSQNNRILDPIALFHNIFYRQWMTARPWQDIKYLELTVPKSEGIGSLLSSFSRVSNCFNNWGIRTFLRSQTSRYSDKMLERMFHIDMVPEDSDESNTIHINSYPAILSLYQVQISLGYIPRSMFREEFLAELEEYREAVLGDKKVLGVLIRGTDYVALNMNGLFRQSCVDDLAPRIDRALEEENYDRIFLATEDQDVLDAMRKRYGKKLIAIAQERHRVKEFESLATPMIYELERQKRSDQAYEDALEDTTVDYFYAIYLLSSCHSLIASGINSGFAMAVSLNEGRYRSVYPTNFH
ncbi:MAG: hypothetical protein Q4B73_06590 [Lachnospiraceae bacterium]|nr:hypothetical protein [Lachnospiraceae bacterium]